MKNFKYSVGQYICTPYINYMSCGIYYLKNIGNGKLYIGQSIGIERRVRRHLSELRNDRHSNRHLQATWNNSPGCFKTGILELCSKEELDSKEQYYLDLYGVDNLYNMHSVVGAVPNWKGVIPSEFYLAVRKGIDRRNQMDKLTPKEKTRIRIEKALLTRAENGWRYTLSEEGKKAKQEGAKKRRKDNLTKEQRENKHNAKSYEITEPSGNKFIIRNLALFCDENGLDNKKMREVKKGKRKSHRGYKIKDM